MIRGKIQGALFGLSLLLGAGNAAADPIAIVGYDVLNASVSGTGSWTHGYTGTITPTGNGFADYSGGTGTMADGVVPATILNNQLFCEDNASCLANSAVKPTITLFLDGLHTVSSFSIFGGNNTGNSIPGAITGADVMINGITVTIASTQFGPLGNSGQLVNDLFTLTGTGLESLLTSSIQLSNITYLEQGSTVRGRFSIAEITVDGNEVPEPSSLLLIGLGAAMIARRRRLVPAA